MSIGEEACSTPTSTERAAFGSATDVLPPGQKPMYIAVPERSA